MDVPCGAHTKMTGPVSGTVWSPEEETSLKKTSTMVSTRPRTRSRMEAATVIRRKRTQMMDTITQNGSGKPRRNIVNAIIPMEHHRISSRVQDPGMAFQFKL